MAVALQAHVFVSGRVQGVFFRDSTRAKALEVGVAGWVRNLQDGRVEAVFEGSREAVDAMLQYCRQGPRLARVDDVAVATGEDEGLVGFEVRPTPRRE